MIEIYSVQCVFYQLIRALFSALVVAVVVVDFFLLFICMEFLVMLFDMNLLTTNFKSAVD
jgi:hypothetical protein